MLCRFDTELKEFLNRLFGKINIKEGIFQMKLHMQNFLCIQWNSEKTVFKLLSVLEKRTEPFMICFNHV